MTTLTFDDSGYACRVPVAGVGKIDVVGGTEPQTAAVPVAQQGAVQRIVELPRFLYAPVRKGEQVGRVRYCWMERPWQRFLCWAAEGGLFCRKSRAGGNPCLHFSPAAGNIEEVN